MVHLMYAFEFNLFPKINVKCEPQLGKRGLRSDISKKESIQEGKIRSDFIAYADGENSIFDISNRIKKNLKAVVEEAKILEKYNLLS